MASENLGKLQATVNRFARDAGFSPLVIDGGMGAKTINATRLALNYSAKKWNELFGFENNELTDQISNLSVTDQFAAENIMQEVVNINSQLANVGDKLGLPPPATVSLTKSLATTNPRSADKSAFGVKPPPGASFWEATKLKFRQMPQWQQAGIGIGGGIALLIAFAKFRGKSKGTTKAGTAGFLRG
jgi:hypothetical protein